MLRSQSPRQPAYCGGEVGHLSHHNADPVSRESSSQQRGLYELPNKLGLYE